MDRADLANLTKFAKVFADARERDANESDTVMFLIEFFKEVLGYDPLGGDISKEVSVKDRYCDFGIRIDNRVAYLVEAKAAGVQALKTKHIEQAENYASRAAINWVVLTNGVIWQLYHLNFGNGIEHELVFEVNLVDDLEQKAEWIWETLSVLSKRSVREESLDAYYEQQKLLSPKNIVDLLLGEELLMKLRQELNRKSPSRLEMSAVFEAVRDVLSQEALAAAGDIVAPVKRRRRRRRRNGEPSEGEAEPREEDEETPKEPEPGSPAAQRSVTPASPAPQNAPPAMP